MSPGKSPSTPRKPRGSKAASTERNAGKVVQAARQEAARLHAEAKAEAAQTRDEAEQHARRLVLDARASAEGVRAEGMEVVSNLRQISDTLRELSERVLEDVEAIHARMLGQLERVAPEGGAPTGEPRSGEPPTEARAESRDELDVPDFVARS